MSTSGTENELPIWDVFVHIRVKTFAFGLRETRRVMDAGFWDKVLSLSLYLSNFSIILIIMNMEEIVRTVLWKVLEERKENISKRIKKLDCMFRQR